MGRVLVANPSLRWGKPSGGDKTCVRTRETVIIEKPVVHGRRGSRSPGRQPTVAVLALVPVRAGRCRGASAFAGKFPLETVIFGTIIAIAAIGLVLYIGELVIIGWVVDFLAGISMPKIQSRTVPLNTSKLGR